MITHANAVSLFVADQDRAKQFYTEVMGFELLQDTPVYPGAHTRWLALRPSAGAQTEIVLYLADEQWPHYSAIVGQRQAITFAVEDMTGTAAALKAKGVVFAQEPSNEPWGHYATIIDSEGNQLILVERPS